MTDFTTSVTSVLEPSTSISKTLPDVLTIIVQAGEPFGLLADIVITLVETVIVESNIKNVEVLATLAETVELASNFFSLTEVLTLDPTEIWDTSESIISGASVVTVTLEQTATLSHGIDGTRDVTETLEPNEAFSNIAGTYVTLDRLYRSSEVTL